MTKKRNWPARFLALAALVAAVIVVIVVASNTDLHSSPDHPAARHARTHKKQHKKQRTKAKTYTVQSGDTLIRIAHKTGLTLAELQALNPEVDAQTLIAGEVLKLRK